METKRPSTILIVFIALIIVGYFFFQDRSFDLPEGDVTPFFSTVEIKKELYDSPPPVGRFDGDRDGSLKSENFLIEDSKQERVGQVTQTLRKIFVTDGVKHSIPIEDIRQGCFGRDCIPSVDDPEFISIKEADKLFDLEGEVYEHVIGISLVFGSEQRFYPFNMLVTREIVNDVVDGVPLLVTYCPLCGTGIVFNRMVNGEVFEFGVSGLLWQSNLLMYNRAESEDDISLWSQVLGEAVLGSHTGVKFVIVPSNISRYSDWRKLYPKGKVLNTGSLRDPYNGDYYRVARRFNPDFDEELSPLSPTEYVFGINIGNRFKAYPDTELQIGTTKDVFADKIIIIKKENGEVVFTIEGDDTPLPIITGFWFSWSAVHPETELYSQN